MKLGRNQAIAIGAYTSGFVSTYALVWVGKLTGPEWVAFLTPFLSIGVATVLGASAAIKVAEGFSSRPEGEP